jgi:hypothetical protein
VTILWLRGDSLWLLIHIVSGLICIAPLVWKEKHSYFHRPFFRCYLFSVTIYTVCLLSRALLTHKRRNESSIRIHSPYVTNRFFQPWIVVFTRLYKVFLYWNFKVRCRSSANFELLSFLYIYIKPAFWPSPTSKYYAHIFRTVAPIMGIWGTFILFTL